MASKFKKDDKVQVICGKDKGKVSKILKIIPKANKVLMEGVGIVKRHTKPNKLNPEGGIISKEMPIDMSNIMHVDPKTNTVTRIGFKLTDEGKRVRYSKKSGELIDNKKA